jgi:hypothetical protein
VVVRAEQLRTDDHGHCLGEGRHHQPQGRVIISWAPVSYRADGVSGYGWLLGPLTLPAGTAATTSISIRKSGQTRLGITPSGAAGLWGDELAPDLDVGPDVLFAG